MNKAVPERAVLYNEAAAAFRDGDLVRSWDKVQQLLRFPTVGIEVLELFGLLLCQQERHADAYDPFSRVAEAQPGNLINQLRLGLAAEAAGRVREAGLALTRAVLISPEEGQVYLQFSGLRWRNGEKNDAQTLVGFTAILQPGNYHVFSIRAQGRILNGDTRGAQRDLIRESILLPERITNCLQLGDTYRSQNWPKQAGKFYRRHCCFGAPLEASAWLSLSSWFTERRQSDRARRALRQAIFLDPGNADAWEKLAESQEGDRMAAAANLSVSAAAICKPENGVAWLRVARHFSDDSAAGSRTENAISMAARYANGMPDTRFALAEFLFQSSDLTGAAMHMDHFFRENHEAILAGKVQAGSARAAVFFLNFIVFRQRPADCSQFLARFDDNLVGDDASALLLTKIRLLAGLDQEYDKRTHIWSSPNRRVVSLPIWGEKYVDLWLQWGLPSLLADGNRAFWKDGETVFHILTTPEDWQRLNQSTMFQDLRTRVSVIFLDLTPIVRGRLSFSAYIAMTLGHWASICIARRENADFIGLVADYIFSDGALTYLSREVAANEMDIAFTIDLPVHEDGLAALDRFRTAAGRIEISPQGMVDTFLGHESSRVRAYEAGPDVASIPTDPSRINIKTPGGWHIASMQPQLFYLRACLMDEFWHPGLPATDNGLGDIAFSILGSASRMRMLNDPEKFCCIVLESGDDDREEKGYFAERRESENSVHDLAGQIVSRRFVTPARLWALERPVRAEQTGAQENELHPESFLAALSDALPPASESVIVAFARRIGFPAFRRYLDWCNEG